MTRAGFGTPVAAIVEVSYATATNTDTADAGYSIGLTDGTTEAVTWMNSEDGVANVDAHHGSNESLCVAIHGAGGAAIDRSATCSFITDGVRLTWQETGTQYQVKVTMFTGTTASVDELTPSGTINGSATVTPGFQAELGFMAVPGAQNNTSAVGSLISVGAFHFDGVSTITQISSVTFEVNNQSTSDPRTFIDNGRAGGYIASGSSPTSTLEVTGVSSTQVTVTTRDNNQINAAYILSLELADVDSWVGTVDSPDTAGSDWSVTSPGFTPQMLGLQLNSAQAYDTSEQDADAGPLGFYTADDTNEYTVGSVRQDGVAPNTMSRLDTKLYLADDAHAQLYNATSPSFDANGWSFASADITAASATTHKWWGWAIEAESSGALLLRRRR